jgi:hypothetical protein
MFHSRVTRRHFLATTGAVGGLSVAAGGAATLLGAQQQAKAAGSLALTGSWEQMVTFQGSAPFLDLVTFNADGTLTETDQPDFAPPSLASPGHGVWVISGANTFRFKFIKLLLGSQAPPSGRAVVHGTLTLSANANTFTASGTDEIFDGQGHLVTAIPFTSHGKRITVEP